MADTEFEEFRQTFEKLPSNLRAPAPFYSIVPILDEDYPSSKSDSSSDQEDDKNMGQQDEHNILIHQTTIKDDDRYRMNNHHHHHHHHHNLNHNNINGNNKNDIDITSLQQIHQQQQQEQQQQQQQQQQLQLLQQQNISQNNLLDKNLFYPSSGSFERKRRKLPEIPKIKKASILSHQNGFTSLADEMGTVTSTARHNNFNNSISQRSLLTLKCSYLLDEDSSPDSERLQSFGDVDSGHSTAHSPNDFKSISPQLLQSPTATTQTTESSFPPPFNGVPLSQLEMLEATHRGLHKFIPRHHDEIEIEIGDPIYVQKEADDLWCEGVNLRTGRQGIFPSAYAVDLDYNDFDPSTVQVKKERYLLGYLGSVETVAHKGTGVVCQAVRKIADEYGDSPKSQPCILEVSDQGLRMVDRSKPSQNNNNKNLKNKGACIDYFYSLKNVSFCAFHPRDHRYIGFITKHPTVQRFACHVFKGHESTRPVAEAVGRAFQRFYQKFIETAYPIEDIYIE